MEFGVQGKQLGELERLVKLFEAGELSAALTVARLLLVSRDVASIERWLAERVPPDTRPHRELLHLIEQHRHGCQCVAALREQHVAEGGRERVLAAAPTPVESDARGNARAECSTRPIVDRFVAWGLLGRERCTLELGCGSGRLQAALAPRVRLAAGIDASPECVARARWCCSRLPNTRHEVGSGSDLSVFDSAAFHFVYSVDVRGVDSLAELVAARDARVTSTFGELARVLCPGGDFVLFTLGLSADVRSGASAPSGTLPEAGFAGGDISQLARRHGFEVVASGERWPQLPDVSSHWLRRRA